MLVLVLLCFYLVSYASANEEDSLKKNETVLKREAKQLWPILAKEVLASYYIQQGQQRTVLLIIVQKCIYFL